MEVPPNVPAIAEAPRRNRAARRAARAQTEAGQNPVGEAAVEREGMADEDESSEEPSAEPTEKEVGHDRLQPAPPDARLVVDRDAPAVHALVRLHIENSLTPQPSAHSKTNWRSPIRKRPNRFPLDGAALNALAGHHST